MPFGDLYGAFARFRLGRATLRSRLDLLHSLHTTRPFLGRWVYVTYASAVGFGFGCTTPTIPFISHLPADQTGIVKFLTGYPTMRPTGSPLDPGLTPDRCYPIPPSSATVGHYVPTWLTLHHGPFTARASSSHTLPPSRRTQTTPLRPTPPHLCSQCSTLPVITIAVAIRWFWLVLPGSHPTPHTHYHTPLPTYGLVTQWFGQFTVVPTHTHTHIYRTHVRQTHTHAFTHYTHYRTFPPHATVTGTLLYFALTR